MRYINVGRVRIRPRQIGSEWWADLTCPAPDCDEPATTKSDTQYGTYEGVCGDMHELHIPHTGKS
jgi:hypothetical protein